LTYLTPGPVLAGDTGYAGLQPYGADSSPKSYISAKTTTLLRYLIIT
jgi:hypothetical protein